MTFIYLVIAFWNSLIHPTKYRWLTLRTNDGSRLIGTVTQEIWEAFTKEEV